MIEALVRTLMENVVFCQKICTSECLEKPDLLLLSYYLLLETITPSQKILTNMLVALKLDICRRKLLDNTLKYISIRYICKKKKKIAWK